MGGNWGTGFPTQWSNQRNISSSCVVQISATQTATIGDNTIDVYDWATGTDQVVLFKLVQLKQLPLEIIQSMFMIGLLELNKLAELLCPIPGLQWLHVY